MAKENEIYDKLSQGRQEAAKSRVLTKQQKDDVDALLHFGTFGKGQTTKDSRLEMRAVLLSAVNDGMPIETAKALKESLRNSPTKNTSDLLKALNESETPANLAVPQILLKGKTGVTLQTTDPQTISEVTIKDSTTISVSEETGQNLDVANSVNLAVKSIITDGAPNQAPDLFRTGGKNVLHYNFADSNNPAYNKDFGNYMSTLVQGDPVHARDIERASKIDSKRGDLPYGEGFQGVFVMAQKTAGFGTGKCGEHAATSFSILTDPASLAQLGVSIPDGSTIILAKGEKIDHSYVLIAAPGSVEFTGGEGMGGRKVNVKDPSKVVVVDPWMPVPTAHTLDRANDEIQLDPEAKLVVTMKKGEPHLVERNGKLTKLTPGEGTVLDKLTDIKERFHPELVNKGKELKLVPEDPNVSLVHACGQLEVGTLGYSPKPLPYHKTFGSTDTPQDQYQCVNKKGDKVGQPASYFVGDQGYLAKENGFIKQSKETPSVLSISRNPENQKLLPEKLSENLNLLREVKGVKLEPDVDKPEIEGEKPKIEGENQPRKKTVGEDLGVSKAPKPKPLGTTLDLDPSSQEKVKAAKTPGKLRENPKMAEIMSKFEKVEEAPKQGVRTPVVRINK